MAESIQHKLDRVRRPRVQITYDVETGGAIVKKELPFVAGIMADLSGKQEEGPRPLKERKFVQIDRDNLDDVMKSIGPRVDFTVDNLLTPDDAEDKLKVVLKFNKMEDFDPVRVVEQIPQLKALLDARQRLSDLITKLDGNDALNTQLREVIGTDKLAALKPAPADA
ncbi:MAG TPA: type VI secretion system contractile sheath small subunit [Longimicrobiaceae bacterium]